MTQILFMKIYKSFHKHYEGKLESKPTQITRISQLCKYFTYLFTRLTYKYPKFILHTVSETKPFILK